MTAVATQMQTSWEKKRREKEARFIHNAKQDLDKCLSERIEEYAAATAELNSAYEKFVLDYAQAEDRIRKLWLQLAHDQQKLLARIVDISKKRQKANEINDSEREKGQVKGLAIAKKAVEDIWLEDRREVQYAWPLPAISRSVHGTDGTH
ncbi:hypothetical protein GSI_11671 [Ganoderma sinense ZZ0214-1]|uniref:Uncharacterized protein n=1 Tax=Ganoderma sinense ZZ0214-1 TaxID=1077348 RepID=A0A2G8RX71_9APHY|nr:hypothetical protein GSI_11671 [Ganoderma sinense ZZ0214-1]